MNNRMIRVFLSSTFRDFMVERNQLNRCVFSELETYCRKQGVSFQVIDLRWGIPEQSAHNNETMKICLNEIDRCQKLSPNMNFLILCGSRYGWRPLPAFISSADWEQMFTKMTEREKTLLADWYLLDENDLKGSYVLRKRTEKEEADWEETERALQEILFPLAGQCLEGEALVPYGLSATEQEIYRGFLTVANGHSLKNTLVILKDAAPEQDELMEPGVAELREKIIEQVGSENADEQILRYHSGNSEETEWMEKVYTFLRRRIDEQIAEIQARETDEEETDRLLEEISYAEKSYLHRLDMEQGFEEFLAHNPGKALLLKGDSGTGKSTWLKHWYYEHREKAVGCFSDTMHYGRSILYAVRFCVAQLAGMGFLKAPETAPNYENLVEWLNESLNRIKTSETITVILDSVDHMSDWKKVSGSLFDMKLRKNVRVLISCVSEASLSENDRRANPSMFSWRLLDRTESMYWLDAYLKQSGRCLCATQKEQILAAMPDQCTALYLYFLSILCGALRSFEPIDFSLPDSTAAMAALLFERQAEHYYPVLYRHAAGYLALSAEGLSEQEILELLSMDPEVTAEIREQTEWSWDESFHIPMVLWSRMYAMLMPLLTESTCGGVVTMRFRHQMLDEVCLSDAAEAGKLRLRMKDYFESERQPWRFASGRVNVRKLQELYPILFQLEDWDRIGRLFCEPDYPDAMIQNGSYQELVDQMLLYREKQGFGEIQERVLTLLLEHPVLFQTWETGFLSKAAGRGIWTPEEVGERAAACYLEEREKESDTSCVLFYIPNSHLYPMALRSDRILAAYIRERNRKKTNDFDARICLYDLNT
ncbi:MAG: DUF4062 domain-containing protein, partial [Lachnospiraceae bacterium]|nr:DUF4062 domain-containing protein [Lachnospiraceae bacterium]